MSALSATIAAQADLLTEVLAVSIDDGLMRLEPCERIWFVGTGTSQHAAELGEWMFLGGTRTVQALSGAMFAHRAPVLGARDGVVVLSHTTETAFARRARAVALDAGAAVVSITGRGKGWPEAIQTVPAETSETY